VCGGAIFSLLKDDIRMNRLAGKALERAEDYYLHVVANKYMDISSRAIDA